MIADFIDNVIFLLKNLFKKRDIMNQECLYSIVKEVMQTGRDISFIMSKNKAIDDGKVIRATILISRKDFVETETKEI